VEGDGGERGGEESEKSFIFTSNDHVTELNGLKFEVLTYLYLLPLDFQYL
jgi:hypothetical protein